ncbi:uncharacterized protein LOC120634910 [Pararge aegeria]|nr:uncharacterized protein LOC120634910 [Pararge aegeria]
MASVKLFLDITSISFILLLSLTQQKTEAARRDSSNPLSLLTKKFHHHEQPVILILGKDAVLKTDRSNVKKALSPEDSDGSGTVHQLHHLLGHDQNKVKQHKKSTTKPFHRDEEKRQRFKVQSEKEEKVSQKEDRDDLRSPIVKKLLRISNSLRCEAKDECEDKCSNKFLGKLKIKCKVKCNYKYDCESEEKEEEKEEKDPCDDSNGSCNSEETGISTKGVTWVTWVTKKPKCKRC